MSDKQAQIQQCFLNLLEEYRFREITIKMIVEAAQVNRSTFYAYYQDKYDLLDSMIDAHLEAITLIIEETTTGLEEAADKKPYVKKYLVHLFQYINAHQQFFKTLMTIHPAQNFTQRFMQTLRQNYLTIIQKEKSIKDPKYFVNYTLGGQFGVLFFWLQNDCQESPYFIADIVYRNILKSNR